MQEKPTPTASGPLDTIFNALEQVRHTAGALGGLCSAFAATGNETMAYKLDGLAAALDEAHDAIRDAYTDDVHARARQASEATTNMVEAVVGLLSR